MTSVLDLERNDTDGALALASESIKAGKYTPELAHILLMLQDDPTDMIDKLSELEGVDNE